jgi:tRNA (cmo5U34)-methyltransferase
MPSENKAGKMLVGDNITSINASWSFAGDVAKNFDSHVSKSVPLYAEGHTLIRKFSDFFLSDDSVCYDIGCSTGALLHSLYKKHAGKKNVTYIGLDNEADMIHVAAEKYQADNLNFLHADIVNAELKKADLIISYYTLQFVLPKYRQAVFDKIYAALNWGGAFIFFEKIRAPDARFQDILNQIYMEYKIDNDYTPEEIYNKSMSLKGVLEPFSENANIEFLQRAGFKDYMSISKYLCFEGFIAIK